MKSVSIIQILVALLMFNSLFCQSDCGPFWRADGASKQIIESEFKSSVVKIRCDANIGTGFFIDNENGYIITAAHVIKKAISDSSVPITFESEFLPSTYNAILVDFIYERNSDLALLKVTTNHLDKITKRVGRLDISLNLPRPKNHFVIGYSRGDDPIATVKKLDVVRLTKRDGRKVIEVQGSGYPGDSGAPLISDQGLVYGVAKSRVDATTSFYSSSAGLKKLLKKMELRNITNSIINDLTKGRISPQELELALKPTFPRENKMSNLDLYHLALYIGVYWKKLPRINTLFYCPISPAYLHREIFDGYSLLSSVASRQDVARSELKIGEREYLLGNIDSAIGHLENASNLLKSSINSHIKTNPASIKYALSATNTDTIDFSVDWLNPINEKNIEGNDDMYLSALFKDLALSNYFLFEIDKNNNSYRDNALISSLLAAGSTKSKSFQAGALILLGDVFFAGKDYKEATESYLAAGKVDNQTPWLTNNIKYSSELGNLDYNSLRVKEIDQIKELIIN
ncbi:serine protease [Algibacter aquimarinus]|uniref:Trypsin-like peptidase domain-containing protein n=1 Tax=Algibacter aquimarinus TaxID=1136748 RepID=A0ABP9HEK5_9FLAO